MSFSVWIQDVDYSSIVDKTVKTAPPVIKLLKSHNWRVHLDRFDSSTRAGMDTCPPVLGLTEDTYGDWMRILPDHDGAFTLTWECSLAGKGENRIHLSGERKRAHHQLTETAIQHFVARDIEWLNENLTGD